MASKVLPLLILGAGAVAIASSKKKKRRSSPTIPPALEPHDSERPLPKDDPNAPIEGRDGGILWRGRYSRPPTFGEIIGGALGGAISEAITPWMEEKSRSDIERSTIEGEGGYLVEISGTAAFTWNTVGFVILRKEVKPYAQAMIRGMRGK